MLYGQIMDGGEVVDDVVVAVYKAPHSYTGEDMVEISCHASRYVIDRIIQTLIANGARAAHAGEFTQRAFLNGKMDLSQAEAVADMIASHDRASHYMASQQMRGGYSEELRTLRSKLLRLVSLMELELDFGEDDVEFADRSEFKALLAEAEEEIKSLTSSFAYGNALKEGVKVTIVGSPNVGKSTLLNALLNEDRAIVSDIAGTTRDVIEDTIRIGGVEFRLTDTAGLRESDEKIERMGMERTLKATGEARIVLLMFDIRTATVEAIKARITELHLSGNQKLCILLNKCDVEGADDIADQIETALAGDECEGSGVGFPFSQMTNSSHKAAESAWAYECSVAAGKPLTVIRMSAKRGDGVDALRTFLEQSSEVEAIYTQAATVSNSRHYEALLRAEEALQRINESLHKGLSTDLIVEDIREMLNHIGEITGEITTEEILSEIFSKFCIGK